MRVTIIDYGSGNLRSAARAFSHVAPRGCDIVVSADPRETERADFIVLPGVGAFADCRAGLAAIDGMEAALEKAVLCKARPFLGICVGMHLMADRGYEGRATPGLGWIGGKVTRLEAQRGVLRIPHMGWNTLQRQSHHPLAGAITTPPPHAYFVHSYAFRTANDAHTLATCTHGDAFAAIVGRDNLVGTQFHPEKSQKFGLDFIARFLHWRP